MIPNDLKEWRLLRQDVPGRVGSAYGIRTRVTGVRGRRPGPLDECATCPTRPSIGPAKGTTDVPERSTGGRGEGCGGGWSLSAGAGGGGGWGVGVVLLSFFFCSFG